MGAYAGNDKRKPRVIWFINIPSPYRVDFFEKLGERVSLTVVFEKGKSDERDSSWECTSFSNFNAFFLHGKKIRTDSAFDLSVVKYLKECPNYDWIMVSNPLSLMGMFIIQYLKSHRFDFYIETDGGFPNNGKGLREGLKRYYISSASGWFSTAKIHDSYYLQYGAREDGIIRYPFTSISESDVHLELVQSDEKAKLRREKEIVQNQVILGVGQFIHRKGFDTLLRACKHLGGDVALVLLGGEPTEEYMDIIKQEKLVNVYFPGFIPKTQISDFYKMANVFVLPTREDIWGLVINEAIAYGLPIVTTDMCIAGSELVEQGENGYIFPANDADALAKYLRLILSDSKLQAKMGIHSLRIAERYTIEKMVECHEQFFEF